MTTGDPLKLSQQRIGFIFSVMIYTAEVHSIKSTFLMGSRLPLSPREPMSQRDEWYRLVQCQ